MLNVISKLLFLLTESTVNASIRVSTPLPIDLEGRIESILKVQSSSLFILGTTFRVEFVAFGGECQTVVDYQ